MELSSALASSIALARLEGMSRAGVPSERPSARSSVGEAEGPHMRLYRGIETVLKKLLKQVDLTAIPGLSQVIIHSMSVSSNCEFKVDAVG